MQFANQSPFDNPRSRLLASGYDLNPAHAIVDPKGQVLSYAQTGGMLSPERHEIPSGTSLYRFGSVKAGAVRVAGGCWWMDRIALDHILGFARVEETSVGLAMRMLCLVPPEWSDVTLLVKISTRQPLLAWRGLANSVVTPAKGGGPTVRMPHHNTMPRRRLHQLYIPGMSDLWNSGSVFGIDATFVFDEAESKRGFLYL